MNDLIHGLERFRLHEAQAATMRNEFDLLIADSRCCPPFLSASRGRPQFIFN